MEEKKQKQQQQRKAKGSKQRPSWERRRWCQHPLPAASEWLRNRRCEEDAEESAWRRSEEGERDHREHTHTHTHSNKKPRVSIYRLLKAKFATTARVLPSEVRQRHEARERRTTSVCFQEISRRFTPTDTRKPDVGVSCLLLLTKTRNWRSPWRQ